MKTVYVATKITEYPNYDGTSKVEFKVIGVYETSDIAHKMLKYRTDYSKIEIDPITYYEHIQ